MYWGWTSKLFCNAAVMIDYKNHSSHTQVYFKEQSRRLKSASTNNWIVFYQKKRVSGIMLFVPRLAVLVGSEPNLTLSCIFVVSNRSIILVCNHYRAKVSVQLITNASPVSCLSTLRAKIKIWWLFEVLQTVLELRYHIIVSENLKEWPPYFNTVTSHE